MALPMYLFYEIGILSAGFFQQKEAGSRRGQLGRPMATSAAGNGHGAVVGLPNVGEGDYVGVPKGRRR